MTTFAYTARDSSGQLINGTLEALDVRDASKRLRGEGKYIVELEQADADRRAETHLTFEQRYPHVKRDDVIYFAHQMSIMIDTGVTIGEALESVAEQTTNEHFAAVVADVSESVHGGQPFSVALAKHDRVFPPLMISLLRASEASGTMGPMLERICTYLTKERNTIKSVRGAMIYPAIMTLVAVAVTIFLLAFVLPRFGKIYGNRGAVLPAPTKMLLFFSEMVVTYWYAWIGLAVAAVGGFFHVRKQSWGRQAIDWLKLHTPILGPMFNQLYLTRAMRTMGTMVSAGVPMLDMIAIVRDVTNNVYYERFWQSVDEQLRQGVQLSNAFFESPLIPSSISRMVHSGEKAGRLGVVMDRIAGFTEHDFDEAVKRTTEFVEPAMVAFMGLLIGFVAIALLLPIFSVSRVMAGG